MRQLEHKKSKLIEVKNVGSWLKKWVLTSSTVYDEILSFMMIVENLPSGRRA